MSFDQIDRAFRRREMVLGLPALATVAAAPAPVHRRYQLFEKCNFNVGGVLMIGEAVGSRCTCSPAPTGTDQDWLVRGPDVTTQQGSVRMEQWLAALDCSGWQRCGDGPEHSDYPDTFYAYRSGEDNLIIAADSHFYDRFKVASRMCQRLNLLEKADRVMVFQGVLYGRWEEGT